MKHTVRTITICSLLAFSLAATGCIASGSRKERGHYIGPETISRITPGETTESWVKSVLGEPTTVTTISNTDGNTTLWRYDWSVTAKASSYLFPLAIASANKESQGSAYIEFKDGVVLRAWRDSSAPAEDSNDYDTDE